MRYLKKHQDFACGWFVCTLHFIGFLFILWTKVQKCTGNNILIIITGIFRLLITMICEDAFEQIAHHDGTVFLASALKYTCHGARFNSCPIGTVFNRFSEPTSSSDMTWRSFSYRQQLHFSNHNIDVPSSCRNCCHAPGIAKLHLKVTTNIGTSPCQSGCNRECEIFYTQHA